jgi:plastocyanin
VSVGTVGHRLTASLLSLLLVPFAIGARALERPGTGSITGHVRLTARVRGTPLRSNVYLPRAVSQPAPATGSEIENVVVYLKDPHVSEPPPPLTARIEQIREAFVPRVLTITRGSTVEFPNGDPYFHNVFSLSRAATFDLGRYPEGKSRTYVFNKAGLVKVFCHIHSHMSATILVLDHSYFATPVADGTFTITDVPPGAYTIAGWHERIGERTGQVTVQAARTATIDLFLPVEDAE